MDNIQEFISIPTGEAQSDAEFDGTHHMEMLASHGRQGNLIMVSNRLPITLEMANKSQITWKPSSGGLVSALTGMKRTFKWIGWLGDGIAEDNQQLVEENLKHQYPHFHPVFFSSQDSDDYYNGFSNSVLWPLFHYLYEKNIVYQEKQWEAYKKVNQIFAEKILQVAQEEDMIWVHDYHLMLVPNMLRKRRPNAKVAFFLHIPFPSSEIYRMLPVRTEILEGLLGAHLIGFHTYNYVRHFTSSCTRLLGYNVESTASGVRWKGKISSLGVFPIGIDPDSFVTTTLSAQVQERIRHFREEQYKDKKIIVGVDRLDITKGIDLKLVAYEQFLSKYTKYNASNVVLIQVGVPSREQVPCYQQMITKVNQIVGHVNSKFGTLDNAPIVYINKSVDFINLCALYGCADVLLVTSIRDGMNLVSCEYVASQEASQRFGVLVLSEYAGASNSLSGSLLVNPWDIQTTSAAICQALDMNHEERRARHIQNFKIVSRNTAAEWGTQFLQMFEHAIQIHELDILNEKNGFVPSSSSAPQKHSPGQVPLLPLSELSHVLAHSQHRLILLNYDDTLVQSQANPALTRPNESVIQCLIHLTNDRRNSVYVISARDKSTLQQWLGLRVPKLGLLAEYGMFVKHPCDSLGEWSTLYPHLFQQADFLSWMDRVVPMFEHVESRTPGSFFEHKETCLSFHYQASDPEYGKFQANELRLYLESIFSNAPIEVVRTGAKVLEVRLQTVSKGAAVRQLLEQCKQVDFVFCAGHDKSDEEMFEAMLQQQGIMISPKASPLLASTRPHTLSISGPTNMTLNSHMDVPMFTCLVGAKRRTRARYRIPSAEELVSVLDLQFVE